MVKTKIAVIGAGITGLTVAYRLSNKGYDVDIIEAGDSIGGLAEGFDFCGTKLEKLYHHVFLTDKDFISLMEELNINNSLQWLDSSMGVYCKDKMYPFMTPFDLLKFPHITFLDKLRMGFAIMYLQKTEKWKDFIKVPAAKWILEHCGKSAYDSIWWPLLKGKFHDFADKVSMAWLYARIHIRGKSRQGQSQEKLGYCKGGFHVFITALKNAIVENDGRIYLNTKVDKITSEKKLIVDGVEKKYDHIICTVPSHVFAHLASEDLQPEEKEKLNCIDYLGAVCAVFTLPYSLGKYYWNNINDPDSPFLVMIEHTKLVGTESYQGKHVYYLGTYVPHNHRFFDMSTPDITNEFFTYLKKIFPKFDIKDVSNLNLFKYKNAQHVVDTEYDKKVPDYQTSIPGVWLVNFSQLFPEDRGINFSILEGNKVANMIINEKSMG